MLDADIRGFFGNMDHGWMLKFVQHRVADSRVLRLIQKWLKAGIMEAGVWSKTEVGTPQGAVISPLLASHLPALCLRSLGGSWRKRRRQGDVIVVRYADDSVLGFQSRADAERFLGDFRERLEKFGLELQPDKTRLIEFGRFAEQNRKQRGEGKPETFDFLGFTHISGKDRNGNFTVRRKTVGKRMRAKLQEVKQQLRSRMHEPIEQTGEWLKSIVRGYFNYHAVPGNIDSLNVFRGRLSWLWRRSLYRRGQRHRLNWERMHRLLERWIPHPRIVHPWPRQRFAATHPR